MKWSWLVLLTVTTPFSVAASLILAWKTSVLAKAWMLLSQNVKKIGTVPESWECQGTTKKLCFWPSGALSCSKKLWQKQNWLFIFCLWFHSLTRKEIPQVENLQSWHHIKMEFNSFHLIERFYTFKSHWSS